MEKKSIPYVINTVKLINIIWFTSVIQGICNVLYQNCYTVFLTTHSVSFGMGNNMAWGAVQSHFARRDAGPVCPVMFNHSIFEIISEIR